MIYDLIHKIASTYYLYVLAGRKDDILKKYPQHANVVEEFANNDPSGNLKYLDWQMKMYTAGHSVNEIIEVINLFHKNYKKLDKKDINQYNANNFDNLLIDLKSIDKWSEFKKDIKQKKDTAVACGNKIIYDSPNFLVRHIFNKAASIHYGRGTKWCITQSDTSSFENYDMDNSVFFFIFDKNKKQDDPMYRVAIAFKRDYNNEIQNFSAFDSLDNRITERLLGNYDGEKAQEYNKIFNIMESIAKSEPQSLLAKFDAGRLNSKELLGIVKHFESFGYDDNDTDDFYKTLFFNYNIPKQLIDYWEQLLNKKQLSLNVIDYLLSSNNIPITQDMLFEMFFTEDSAIEYKVLEHPKLKSDTFKKIINELDRYGMLSRYTDEFFEDSVSKHIMTDDMRKFINDMRMKKS